MIKRNIVRKCLRRSISILLLFGVVSTSTAFSSQAANAAVTKKDFQVMLRTIGFMQNAPSGSVSFTIVYDPNSAQSVQDASDLQSILKDGAADKALVLHAQLVPVSNLPALENKRLVFVTSGLEKHYAEIGALTRKSGALSFSLNRACAEQGNCVVYISSEGRVEIAINKQAAEESAIVFKPVFLMMVNTL